jgi:choline dehydrogenase
MADEFDKTQDHDFVIVGSGAGGGPLAANLALAGFSVLLIEAGGDAINDNYSVPAFHALSTEDPLYSWEFFVRHYSERPDRDPKYQGEQPNIPGTPGILYPRASGLGGCTTHHAMITVYPAESDWDDIARLVADESWSAANMRKYFDRIEHAQYRDGSVLLKLLHPPSEVIRSFLNYLTGDETGDGARGPLGAGWLTVSQADPLLLLNDVDGVLKIALAAFETAWADGLRPMPGLNPNDPVVAADKMEGINVIPISVDNGKRVGARERVLRAQAILSSQSEQGKLVGKLDVATNTFVTRIEFDRNDPTRAIGVSCAPGEALYGARHHKRPKGEAGESRRYLAKKEMILCGGAFNTPQILMLSGIGPEQQLKELGIDVRVKSEGVGRNLQDRYEVGVVARAAKPFRLVERASFTPRQSSTDPDPDPVFTEWREDRRGIYATNGAVLGIIKRSSTRMPTEAPDLYIFGVPGDFTGYRIGYSKDAIDHKDHFTWAALKGHTENESGVVSLKSTDPFEPPEIHFKNFEDSSESYKNDLQSVVDGIEFAQKIYDRLEREGLIAEQLSPKPREDLYEFVRNNAWGHHASCTCRIGPDGDELAVLGKDFNVRGAKNLRVVDASVFPRIPGLFILSSVYMVGEKASEIIINHYSTRKPNPDRS